MNNDLHSKSIKKLTSLSIIICTVLCVALFISMIVLAAVYLIRTQRYKLYETDELPENALDDLKSGGSYHNAQFNVNYILPEFVGFRIESKGGFIGVSSNADAVRNFYTTLSKQITYALGSSSLCAKADGVEGEALWDACLAAGDYVYIRYVTELPDYMIRCFFGGDYLDNVPEGDIALVKELFLIYVAADDGYNLHAVAKSTGGDIYSFDYDGEEGEERQTFSTGDIETFYRNVSFTPCSFASDSVIAAASELPLSSTTIIYEYTQSSQVITSSEDGLKTSDDAVDTLLRLFDYNPDRLNQYTESAGKKVYVESHGILRLSEDGIEYSASDGGGVSLSEFIGYGSYGDYSIYETILALCSAAEKLNSIFDSEFGGNASLRIGNISYNSEESILNVDFVYAYNNIVIYENNKPFTAMSFSVKNGYAIGVAAYPLKISGTPLIQANYPQAWILEKLAELTESSMTGGMKQVYNIIADKTDNDSGADGISTDIGYSAVWIYITAENALTYKSAAQTSETETGSEVA